jgi:hypothetical protein
MAEVKSDDEEVEEFNEEIRTGDADDDFYDDNKDKIKEMNRIPDKTKEVYSGVTHKYFFDNISNSISDKIVLILTQPWYSTHENYRKGNIKVGIMTPQTAKMNNLPEIFVPVMYTTDNGSNYIKGLNLIPEEEFIKHLPEVKVTPYVLMGEGDLEKHYQKISDELKKARGEDTSEIKEEIISNLEKLGFSEDDYIQTRDLIANKSNNSDIDKMIEIMMGKLRFSDSSNVFKEEVKKMLKKEKNRGVLEKMTVMPLSLGALTSSLPPPQKPLIGNIKLRAELNIFGGDLANNLPSGRFMLTPEVKKAVKNICDLISMVPDHPEIQSFYALMDILDCLTADALEATDSLHSDNEKMLNICNLMSERFKRERKPFVRGRALPSGSLSYPSSY